MISPLGRICLYNVLTNRSWSGNQSLQLFSRSSQALSNLLINQPKFHWLQELGLAEDNPGVFDGDWKAGSGPVSKYIFNISFTTHSSLVGANQ